MTRHTGNFSVARHLVSVLADGAIVVQWGDARVQDVLSGEYRTLGKLDRGRPATDPELEQLRLAGRVERFNRNFVWLAALPELNRFPELHVQERSPRRLRAFYVNTTLPETRINDVRGRLHTLGLDGDYAVADHAGLVAIMRPDSSPFPDIKAAENAQRELILQAYDLFKESAVAFIDTALPYDDDDPKTRTMELTNLGSIIASQTDTTLTRGKRAVLVVADGELCHAMVALLDEMGIQSLSVPRGSEALALLEDTQPDLLIADLNLSDMHAWQLIAKAREIAGLQTLLTAVIAPPTSADSTPQAFGSTLSQVDAYLVTPFSMSRFRLSIWLAFRHQADSAG